MSISSALTSLPSKPGLAIAGVLAFVVISLYYLNQYNLCSDLASLRGDLYSGVAQSKDTELYLAEIIPFTWDRARVILDFQHKGKLLDCPFNWDWTQDQRRQLMSRGQLNVIAFARNDSNTVVDFDSEIIDFDLDETVLTPESAKFRIHRSDSRRTQFLLSQIK